MRHSGRLFDTAAEMICCTCAVSVTSLLWRAGPSARRAVSIVFYDAKLCFFLEGGVCGLQETLDTNMTGYVLLVLTQLGGTAVVMLLSS